MNRQEKLAGQKIMRLLDPIARHPGILATLLVMFLLKGVRGTLTTVVEQAVAFAGGFLDGGFDAIADVSRQTGSFGFVGRAGRVRPSPQVVVVQRRRCVHCGSRYSLRGVAGEGVAIRRADHCPAGFRLTFGWLDGRRFQRGESLGRLLERLPSEPVSRVAHRGHLSWLARAPVTGAY